MRAAVVHQFGSPPTPEPGPGQVLVREEIQRLGGADAVVLTTASPKPIEQAFRSLARGGTMVFVGLHRLGRTRVQRAERRLEQVNDALAEVLDGTAPAPRLVLTA